MFFGKKLTRIAAVAAAVVMTGALAGCGSSSGDTIKIGANFELTGNVANYGSATYDGLKLAVKEANDAGGINGKKIELVAVDNKSTAEEAVNEADFQ